MNSLGHTTEVIDEPLTAYELADELIAKKNIFDKPRNTDAANMLRQQADRIAELEKECAWAKDQWNKDRICFESRRNELEKDLALKTRDRDVFSNFTLAYEKRIEELEKELDTVDKAYKWMDETYKGTLAKLEQAQSVLKELGWHEINKDGYAKPQTKPLSNDEIREIGDDCVLKNNGILNWIDFAKAILRKAQEK